jgi:hypothetical protein
MRVKRVNISGPVAWVHGIETSKRRTKSGEATSGRNYGTNIFVHRNGRWLMVFHQAAEIPPFMNRLRRLRYSRAIHSIGPAALCNDRSM